MQINFLLILINDKVVCHTCVYHSPFMCDAISLLFNQGFSCRVMSKSQMLILINHRVIIKELCNVNKLLCKKDTKKVIFLTKKDQINEGVL